MGSIKLHLIGSVTLHGYHGNIVTFLFNDHNNSTNQRDCICDRKYIIIYNVLPRSEKTEWPQPLRIAYFLMVFCTRPLIMAARASVNWDFSIDRGTMTL